MKENSANNVSKRQNRRLLQKCNCSMKINWKNWTSLETNFKLPKLKVKTEKLKLKQLNDPQELCNLHCPLLSMKKDMTNLIPIKLGNFWEFAWFDHMYHSNLTCYKFDVASDLYVITSNTGHIINLKAHLSSEVIRRLKVIYNSQTLSTKSVQPNAHVMNE